MFDAKNRSSVVKLPVSSIGESSELLYAVIATPSAFRKVMA